MQFLVAITFLAAGSANEPLSISAARDPARVEVVAELPRAIVPMLSRGGVKPEFAAKWLTFATVDEKGKAGPAMFGTYTVRNNRLTFKPRFPLSPGVRYRATLKIGRKTFTAEYRVPRSKTKPPAVQQIYPSADVLPANNLKFYIVFSKPMREGCEIFDRIQLIDDRGKAVADPWRARRNLVRQLSAAHSVRPSRPNQDRCESPEKKSARCSNPNVVTGW